MSTRPDVGEGSLLEHGSAPGVRLSVVIPMRNAADTIDLQLDALASQTYDEPWELVVGDNGSTDDSIARVQARAAQFPRLTVVSSGPQASRPHTRNAAVAASSGSILAFCDADDRVARDWLARLVAALENADLVAGQRLRLLDDEISGIVVNREDAPLYDFLPFADTCNMAVRRQVFEALGGFDTAFTLSSDVDFSWRAQLAGYRFVLEPLACVGKRYPNGSTGPSRQQRFGWGRMQPRLYRRYRSAGMPRSSTRSVLTSWGSLALAAPLLPTRRRKVGWGGDMAELAGRLVGSVENRVLYL